MITISKLYKVELYITDVDGEYSNIESFKNRLDYVLQRLEDGVFIANLEASNEFEWNDNLTINHRDASTEDYEKYFK